MAHDAADMAAEAASLTRGWADPQEREQAQRRANQARAAAHEAQHRADLAELQADQAQEAADLAQEFADEAEELACEAENGEFGDEEFQDGPRGPVHRGYRTHGHPDYRGHPGHPGHPGPVPPLPPRPPHPPGPPGQSQNRVEQILWRFDQFRERASGGDREPGRADPERGPRGVQAGAFRPGLTPGVSVPEQGGCQACRVPVMWFTAPSAGPVSVQLPAVPVLAARAGDLSAVSGVRAPETQTNAGGGPARTAALRVPDAAPGRKS